MSLNPAVLELVGEMITVGAVSFRDVENGEEPFLYSSGNRGPGYVMVKGLVSQRALLRNLTWQLTLKVGEQFPDVDYVAGNATGGMIPGWLVAEHLTTLTGRHIPYFYVRGTRKQGGHGEVITGDKLNPFFAPGRRGLVVEELVNFAETTTNSTLEQRKAGYDVQYAATILSYDHDRMKQKLEAAAVTLISLITLSELLEVADRKFPKRLVDDYRTFLKNPKQWQLDRGYELPKQEKENT